MKLYDNIWFLIGAILLVITGCRDDRYSIPDIESGGSDKLMLDINLYGENQGAGLKIKTLDVLSFYSSGEEELFLYKSTGTVLLEETGTTKRYEVEIEKYNGIHQRLVFIANARDKVNLLGEIEFRATKEEVLKKLEYSFAPRGIIDPDDDTDPAYIPMWGESGLVIIDGRSGSLDKPIDMIRSVVRLDVTVAGMVRNDFVLQEVYLYNPDQTGRIVPATGVYNASSKVVTEATMPVTPQRITAYPAQPAAISSDGIKTGQKIYMVENAPASRPQDATCLIVGGVYKGDAGTTYYRVDFRTPDRRAFRSLLRNHHYTVGITSILGSGYETPEEAFEKTWKNIESDMIGWSLTEIEWEDHGHYWLRVSPGTFSYMKEGGTGSFTICTDYDNLYEKYDRDGWKGELFYGDPTDRDWIVFTGGATTWSEEGDPDVEYPFNFTIGQYTGNPWKRHAWIQVQAGNLTKYVDIYQSNEVWVDGDTGDIYDWVESGQSDIEVDRFYRLGVTRTGFELIKQDTTCSFSISTDYKEGYHTRVVTSDGGNWLTIDSGDSGEGPGDKQLVFSITHNGTTLDREAIIYVTAGNLVKAVVIRQFTWIGNGEGSDTDAMEWLESEQSPNGISGYRLGVSRTQFEVTKGDAQVSVRVSTDHEEGYHSWVETSDGGNTWLTIDSGGSLPNAGDETLQFTIDHNTTTFDRTTTIYIQAGNLIKSIYVKQVTWIGDEDGMGLEMEWADGGQSGTGVIFQYRMGVSQTNYTFTKNARQDILFYLTTDYTDGYTIEVTEGDHWLTNLTPASNNAGVTNQPVTFDILENNSLANRQAVIEVRAGNLVKHITVTQTSSGDEDITGGGIPWEDSEQSENEINGVYLGLSKSRYDLSQNRYDQMQLYLTANSPEGYTIEVTRGDNWITNLSSTGSSVAVENELITFDVAENKTYAERQGEFLIRSGSLMKYIRIYQDSTTEEDIDTEIPWTDGGQSGTGVEFQNVLGVSETNYRFTKNAQTNIRFYVTTDYTGGFSIEVTGGNWVTNLTPGNSSTEVTNQPITFDLLENNTLADRHAVIVVRAGNMVKHITVMQTSSGDEDITGGGIPWEDSEQSENEINGVYLGLSKSRFNLSQNRHDQVMFELTSDNPEGYTIEVSKGNTWITNLSPLVSNTAVQNQVITFDVSENKTYSERQGELLIRSGSIMKYIPVYQDSITEEDIETNIPWTDGGQSGSEANIPYTLNVEKVSYEFSKDSNSGKLYFTADGGGTWSVSGAGNWISVTGLTTGTADGSRVEIDFTIAQHTGASDRTGYIRLHLMHNGNRIVKDIPVTQYARDLVSATFNYPDGGNRYLTNQFLRQWFTLKSETAWEIEIQDDPAGIVRTLYTTGGAANAGSGGGLVYFVMNSLSSGGPYEAKLQVKSVTGAFQPYTIVLRAEVPPVTP